MSNVSPSKADWLEMLDALRAEAHAGRLKSLTFMLALPDNPDSALIDYIGTPEVTEIACRKTVEQIADTVARTNASLASAIRSGMSTPKILL